MLRRDDVSGTTVCRVVDGAREDPRVSFRPTSLIRLRHAASASRRRGVITSVSCWHTLACRPRFASISVAVPSTVAVSGPRFRTRPRVQQKRKDVMQSH